MFFLTMTSVLSDKFLEVMLVDHRVVLFLVFEKPLFSVEDVLFSFPLKMYKSLHLCIFCLHVYFNSSYSDSCEIISHCDFKIIHILEWGSNDFCCNYFAVIA